MMNAAVRMSVPIVSAQTVKQVHSQHLAHYTQLNNGIIFTDGCGAFGLFAVWFDVDNL